MNEVLQFTSKREFSELSVIGEMKRAEVLARDLPTMLLTHKDMMGRPDLDQRQARDAQEELEVRQSRLRRFHGRATPVPGGEFHHRFEALQRSRADLQKLAETELGSSSATDRRVRLSADSAPELREAVKTLVGNITFRVGELFTAATSGTSGAERQAAAKKVIGELQAVVGGDSHIDVARRIGATLEAALHLSGPRFRQEPLPHLAADYRARLMQIGAVLNLRGSVRTTLLHIIDRLPQAN